MWLDDEPGIANGMGGWRAWHSRRLTMERTSPATKRLAAFFVRQVWVVFFFFACSAGLQIPADAERQNPFPRSWVLLGNAVVFLVCSLIFYSLAGARVNVVLVCFPATTVSRGRLRTPSPAAPPPADSLTR